MAARGTSSDVRNLFRAAASCLGLAAISSSGCATRPDRLADEPVDCAAPDVTNPVFAGDHHVPDANAWVCRALSALEEPDLVRGTPTVRLLTHLDDGGYLSVRAHVGDDALIVVKEARGGGSSGALIRDDRRPMTRDEIEAVRAALAAADLRSQVRRSETFGLDGVWWIFDLVDEAGSIRVHRWSASDANTVALAKVLLRISGKVGDPFDRLY